MNHKDFYQFKQDKTDSEIARQIVKESKNIPDFGYHGEADLGETWAFTFSVNRDSDVLERSNWEVISEDMITRHPKNTIIDHCSHWACGWEDHLSVKMITKNGRITKAGRRVLYWLDKLDGYPAADEDHYSNMEYEEYSSNMEESIKCESRATIDDKPESWVEIVVDYIKTQMESEFDSAWDNEGWLYKEDILEALGDLGWLEKETD
jgi:hypothetical protein